MAEDPEVPILDDKDWTWVLEYGCHVRDVLEICGGRLDLMLATDHPVGASFPSWDQDATAVEKRYSYVLHDVVHHAHDVSV